MPQPAGSINLIPQEERAEQKRTKAIKASTVFAIVLFVVVGCASAYVRYSVYKLQNQVEMHEENISQLRAEIQNMAEIEVVARNLDKKYAALQEAFDARIYYSTLLTELRNRLSSGVQVNEYSMRGSVLNLSGMGSNYIAISGFLSNLAEPKESMAEAGLGNLFSDVSLNSVNLDNRSGGAKYDIVVGFNEGLLYK